MQKSKTPLILGEQLLESKIQDAICEKIQPLFEEWKNVAGWTEEEAFVMYHKLFNASKPNDLEIQKILADKFSRHFAYYHRIKINRIYNSARKKLYKVLP